MSTTLASDAASVLDVVVPNAGVTPTQVTSSAEPAATVADAGWFVAPLDVDLTSGAEGESVTLTVADAVPVSGAVDAVMTLADFNSPAPIDEPLVVSEAGDEDAYASLVDTLMADETGVLADWV